MKVGYAVKLTDEDMQIVAPLKEEAAKADIAFKVASGWLRDSNMRVWYAIRELHPELKDAALAFDHETNTVRVTSQTERLERMIREMESLKE